MNSENYLIASVYSGRIELHSILFTGTNPDRMASDYVEDHRRKYPAGLCRIVARFRETRDGEYGGWSAIPNPDDRVDPIDELSYN